MTAGKTYVIDMQRKAFDTFLKLEDAQGKLLAENDDISPTNRNSRILFTPKQDGTYRIIAASFQQQSRARYEIIIREYAAKKKQPSKGSPSARRQPSKMAGHYQVDRAPISRASSSSTNCDHVSNASFVSASS